MSISKEKRGELHRHFFGEKKKGEESRIPLFSERRVNAIWFIIIFFREKEGGEGNQSSTILNARREVSFLESPNQPREGRGSDFLNRKNNYRRHVFEKKRPLLWAG